MMGWWELALGLQLMTLDDRLISFSSIQLNSKSNWKRLALGKRRWKIWRVAMSNTFRIWMKKRPTVSLSVFPYCCSVFSFSNRCKWTAGRICRLGVGTMEVQVTCCPSCSIHGNGVAHVVDTDLSANSRKRGTACRERTKKLSNSKVTSVPVHTHTTRTTGT